MEKHAGVFHGLQHLVRFLERHGDGLFAKHRLPVRDRVDDHFFVRAGGSDHGYGFHLLIAQQFLVALVPFGNAEFPGELFGKVRFLVRHRHQPRVGDALHQVLRIDAPHLPNPIDSDIQDRL